MSVLIKGVEMPTRCFECPCLYHSSERYPNTEYNCAALDAFPDVSYDLATIGRLEDCPLVPVPTPHGRLIDADALLKGKSDHDTISTHEIWNAPTVVESEE